MVQNIGVHIIGVHMEYIGDGNEWCHLDAATLGSNDEGCVVLLKV